MKTFLIVIFILQNLFNIIYAQPWCNPPTGEYVVNGYMDVDAPTFVWQPFSNPDSGCTYYCIRVSSFECMYPGGDAWVSAFIPITDSCITIPVAEWLNRITPNVTYAQHWAIYTWGFIPPPTEYWACFMDLYRHQGLYQISYTTLISPPNNAVNIPLNPSMSWSSITGANEYKVSIYKTPTFQYLKYDTIIASTNVTIRSGVLESAKNYWWKVKAYSPMGEQGTGPYSDPFKFTTIMNVPPAVPNLVSPPNGSSVYTLTPTLDWDSILNASTYTVQISTDPNFLTLIYNNPGITNSFVTLTAGLSYETPYYWRVRAVNTYGSSSWSGVWSFTIVPQLPAAPNLVAPLNNSEINTLTPTLDWDSIPIASSYRLQIAGDSAFTVMMYNDSNITNSFKSISSGLNYNYTYYWKVRAKNSNGTGPWSPVWKFSIAQANWVNIGSVGYEVRSSYFLDINTGWVCCEQYKIFKTTNGGQNWAGQSDVNDPMLFDIFFINQNTGWSCGNYGFVRKTTNGGTNWVDSAYTGVPNMGLWFTDVNTGYMASMNKAFKTTNAGNSWTQIFSCSGYVQDVFFPVSSTGMTGYICGNYGPGGNAGAINKTTNAGLNWSQLPVGTITTVNALYFVNALKGWAGIWNGTILFTTNGGSNWTSQTTGSSDCINSLVFINDNTGWASAVNGKIYVTTNSGVNWTQQVSTTSLPLYSIKVFPDGHGWAFGQGGIVLYTTNGGGIMVNAKKIGHEIPKEFSLMQNYPNPFNPVTNIKYHLPNNSDVKIIIYDISGKEIEVLINDKQNAGIYEVEWNAGNYSSGVYFYKISAGNYVESKKMVLIK
ncbi:MAG: T9SS C-terminal target domain-containing protein [Ignavibacteriae bacterium]|nr:MAG: T9SS C-terminal target domain-containing protein [Ignavibacteriota bacterium]